MTVRIYKDAINLREKLAELDKPTGIAGEAMLRAETPQEQFNLIGAGRRNFIINGAMEFLQRNATFSGASGYSLDRWKVQQDAGVDTTCSRVDVASGTAPYALGFRKAIQLAVTNTSTATNFYAQIGQYFEGYDAAKWGIDSDNGNHITLSFWVKVSLGGTYYAFVDDANSGYRFPFEYHVNANEWKYVTVTVPPNGNISIDNDNSAEFRVILTPQYGTIYTSSAAKLNQWQSHNGGAFTPDFPQDWANTSGATFQVTGVQLELGKVATPFEHRSYGEELALCQRYYYQPYETEGDDTAIMQATTKTTSQIIGVTHFPVAMRDAPSVVNSSAQFRIDSLSKLASNTAGSTILIEVAGTSSAFLKISGFGGLVADNSFACKYIAGTFAFNSEL